MRTTTYDIVSKLWNLCNILRDGGINYFQYVIELTYLLFLKMAQETGSEAQLPVGYRWENLLARKGSEQLEFYGQLLEHLGSHGAVLVREIFADARSYIQNKHTLSTLVSEIEKLDWYSATQEGLGDIYEGLLEKNAGETKAGAGQYFTPRALINSMVRVMQPNLDDVIQDPAAGTGGFLIAADRYIQEHQKPAKWTEAQKRKYRSKTFYGMEIVSDTSRLALMNLMLHGLDFNPDGGGVHHGNALSLDVEVLPKATLMLTNPPFGSQKGGGLPTREDFEFPTSNKQFCFLQHIYLGLKSGGRAAAIFPDNVLFENNLGRQIRADLMDKCNLHTILRLPTGIFYAQGVKTNVLFFTRGKRTKGNTKEVWVYDLRSNMPQFGRRTSLTRDHFEMFEEVFGRDPLGGAASLAKRVDMGEEGQFRRFSREWIAEREDNLDISWLKDESERERGKLSEPVTLAEDAMRDLAVAMAKLENILRELGEEVSL
jgi:type I restriction enzyme M protein